eukprot:3579575-Rhodomonas_salina.1
MSESWCAAFQSTTGFDHWLWPLALSARAHTLCVSLTPLCFSRPELVGAVDDPLVFRVAQLDNTVCFVCAHLSTQCFLRVRQFDHQVFPERQFDNPVVPVLLRQSARSSRLR